MTGLDANLVVEALQEVDEVYRGPLTLFYLQDFSYKEIAETVSSNENAVKVKTFRAIQKLKEIYTQIIMD